jgi:DNA repair protein RadA/Sms
MALKTIFSCQNCGYQSPKWLGRCPECRQWSTLAEEPVATFINDIARQPGPEGIALSCPPQRLSDIKTDYLLRVNTGIGELDRVLGGGLVNGCVLLVGGEPGIGKSTLMLQASGMISRDKKVLYISGEESVNQLKLRSKRIKLDFNNFFIVSETNVMRIVSYIKELKPYMAVIDSVQTIYNPEFPQSAGTVTQIKESAGLLALTAKALGVCVFFIGHITKEGIIAGPKVLEHIVDSVIYFEGQRESDLRVLRAIKNRFGATDEIGIFSMDAAGLKEVRNPSNIFISHRQLPVPGASTMSALEGSRAILVEIQALVSLSSYGMPRQRSTGLDPNRMSLLVAGLIKNIGINLANQDVFLNVVGGVRADEPACDLAACVSIYSSFKEKPVRRDTVIMGEVGLCSEVRSISRINLRINEAKRMGYRRIVMPASDLDKARGTGEMELIGVGSVKQALGEVFD